MKLEIPLILILSACLLLPLAMANGSDKGAEQMDLFGGTRGKVPFPHHQHQKNLGDCNACHDVFPQTAGAIESMKAQGKLKQKQVMNKQCIKCHRAEKK